MAADLLAANAAELSGVALAGVLVGAFGVPWSILGLGLAVAVVALTLAALDRRDQRAANPARPERGVAVPS
jgi:hypothetical protein